MNILHIIDSMDPARGGPVENILQSAAEFARQGHRSAAVSLDRRDDPWISAVPIDHYPQGHVFRRYGYSPSLAKWLKAEARAYDAAIIHGLWTYATVGSVSALAAIGLPCFVFAHGMMDPWFGQAQPIKNMAKQLYWRMLLGPALAKANAVLFTTEEERRLARAAFPSGGYRERVVCYGTADAPDDEAAQIGIFRQHLPVLGGRRFLLFLGRIHPKKGCDLLIRAFAKVAADHANLDLVIAGPDQVGWRQELESIAEELEISRRVHFPGMLSGPVKWGAFRAAEAFILPSHQENFGIAVAEAMACGKPVLITDKVNIWRDIEAAGCGFVASDDQQGIDSLLAQYFGETEAGLRERGRLARRCFIERFGIAKASQDILALIAEAATS